MKTPKNKTYEARPDINKCFDNSEERIIK